MTEQDELKGYKDFGVRSAKLGKMADLYVYKWNGVAYKSYGEAYGKCDEDGNFTDEKTKTYSMKNCYTYMNKQGVQAYIHYLQSMIRATEALTLERKLDSLRRGIQNTEDAMDYKTMSTMIDLHNKMTYIYDIVPEKKVDKNNFTLE